MKFTKLAITLLCCVTLFCGCAKNDDVVLKINDKNITRVEFYSDFNKIKDAQLKNAPKELKKDNSYTVLALKTRYTNDVIARELLREEFAKRKIQVSEDEIKAKKESLIKQIGSKEQFENLLKQNNISEERLNSDMANEVKMDKLINSLSKVTVKNSDIEKFYKMNKENFTVPERIQVSHILFNTNKESVRKLITENDKEAKLSKDEIEKMVEEQVSKNEKLAKEVRQMAANSPKSFAKLAKEYSQDTGSAKMGGDLGYVTREQLIKEFSDAAFKQKVGVVSELVNTPYGLHIILVKDKTAKTIQPLSVMRADIKAYLTKIKKNEVAKNFIDGLKSKSKIEYVDKTLNPTYIQKQIAESFEKQQIKQAKTQKVKLNKNEK